MSEILEIGTYKAFVLTKKLIFHGKPVEELEKPELLKALQEITFVAMLNKDLYEKMKASREEWRAFAYEITESKKRW